MLFSVPKEAFPKLISFTIKRLYVDVYDSYQAEQGMTWKSWVASSYNTGQFRDGGNYITYGGGAMEHVGLDGNTPVKSQDVIIEKYAYVDALIK